MAPVELGTIPLWSGVGRGHRRWTRLCDLTSAVDRAYQIHSLLPICRDNGTGVVAKRPLANAAWRGFSDLKNVATKASVYTQRLAAMHLDLPALGFTDDNAGWSELALRFNLSLEGLHSSIIGTKNPNHARVNLEILEKGPLPAETLSRLFHVFQNAASASECPWAGEN